MNLQAITFQVREIPEDTYLDIQRVPRANTTAFSMPVREREGLGMEQEEK